MGLPGCVAWVVCYPIWSAELQMLSSIFGAPRVRWFAQWMRGEQWLAPCSTRSQARASVSCRPAPCKPMRAQPTPRAAWPQVGNRAFAARFRLECPNCWALVNQQDPVPRVPGTGEPSRGCGWCSPGGAGRMPQRQLGEQSWSAGNRGAARTAGPPHGKCLRPHAGPQLPSPVAGPPSRALPCSPLPPRLLPGAHWLERRHSRAPLIL